MGQIDDRETYNMPAHIEEIKTLITEIKDTLNQHTKRLARIENVMTQLVSEYGDMRIRVRDLEASEPIGKET